MTESVSSSVTTGPGGDRPAGRKSDRRDVVFAVRRTAPARRRLPWRRGVAAVSLLLVLGAGSWWLTQSGVFAVARVGTGAYRFTDERALKTALAPLLGRNLWALTPGDVRQALASLPWVKEVYVQRRLPGSVDIELIEWRPLLVVAETGAPVGASTLVLVEDGRVLPFPARLPAPELPVLTGVLVERSATGPAHLPAALSARVLELVAALESSGLEAVSPVDFVVADAAGFGLVLQKDETRLLVGREDFADRLGRYLTAREHVAEGVEIDLRFKGKLTVRARALPADEEAEGQEPGESEGGAAPGGTGKSGSPRRAGIEKAQHQRQAGTIHRPAAKENV